MIINARPLLILTIATVFDCCQAAQEACRSHPGNRRRLVSYLLLCTPPAPELRVLVGAGMEAAAGDGVEGAVAERVNQ